MFSFLTLFSKTVLDGVTLLISYISTGKAFLQPLSEEKEKKYIRRLQTGDREARNVLIERNMRLVAHIVKKFDNVDESIEDLISIGTIGLIKAINSYNPNKSTKLATYAARCIENEILMYLRKTKKLKNERMIHEPIGCDKEGNEIRLLDILGTDADEVSKEVELILNEENLYKKLEKLNDRERKVLNLRYGLKNNRKRTQREIANKLDISRSYVSRIEKKAINKLNKEFEVE